MSNDELAEMLGHKPNEVLRRKIIEETRETGLDVREIISRYTLPTIAVIDDYDGKFWSIKYAERLTPAEWFEKNPLGKFAKLVIITPK